MSRKSLIFVLLISLSLCQKHVQAFYKPPSCTQVASMCFAVVYYFSALGCLLDGKYCNNLRPMLSRGAGSVNQIVSIAK